jgi:hypothetical protein
MAVDARKLEHAVKQFIDRNTHATLEQTQKSRVAFQNHAHIKRPNSEAEYLELHALLDHLTNLHAMA